MRRYYTDLVDRAVRTAAQSALLTIGADQINAFDADYKTVLGMALGGAVLSVLTSLADRGLFGRNSD